MKHFPILLQVFILPFVAMSQNIGIGTAVPHTSAMLDISSTAKGLLIPRMNNTAMNGIAAPANGLMLYNTSDSSLYIYKGLAGWRKTGFDIPYAGISALVYPAATGVFNITYGGSSQNDNAIVANGGSGSGLFASSSSGTAIRGISSGAVGIDITGRDYGVYAGTSGTSGSVGVFGASAASAGSGVLGSATGTNGHGIKGTAQGALGYGVYGLGVYGGVYALSTSGYGLFAESVDSTAITAISYDDVGIYGYSGAFLDANAIGIKGIGKRAVLGISYHNNGTGISGEAWGANGAGVSGKGKTGVKGETDSAASAGVLGKSNSATNRSYGVKGMAPGASAGDTTAGVYGEISTIFSSTESFGVIGKVKDGFGVGVLGQSEAGGTGVTGVGNFGAGVFGRSANNAGIIAQSTNGYGLRATSNFGTAIYGEGYSAANYAVLGTNTAGTAIFGESFSATGEGVRGRNATAGGIGILGLASNTNGIAIKANATGSALYALSANSVSGTPGYFETNSGLTTPHIILYETANDYARINFQNNTTANYWTAAGLTAATAAASNARLNFYYSNLNNGGGGDALSLTGNGDLYIAGNAFKPGGGAWNVPSDSRLKKNITDFTDGLNVINQVHPVSFQYNGLLNLPANHTYTGVLAQELESIAPYMVKNMKYDAVSYLQVDPNAFTYLLINAVKELHTQNVQLKQQNQKLEKDITAIKNKLGIH